MMLLITLVACLVLNFGRLLIMNNGKVFYDFNKLTDLQKKILKMMITSRKDLENAKIKFIR